MEKSRAKNKKQWDTTREANLLKNVQSGRYYARFAVAGKQKWINLNTDIWSVAKLRLADERTRIERMRQASTNVSAGHASVGQLIAVYRQRVNDRTDIASKTKVSALGSLDTVVKTWPGFEQLAPAHVTRRAVLDWRNRITRDGTGWILPGAKGPSAKSNGRSYSTINHSIDAIRLVLDIAVEHGQLVHNPIQGRGIKVKRNPRKPKLPEPAKLAEIFSEIERGGGGSSRAAAEFCRFLAYTGCRLTEAKGIKWGDVDFTRGIIFVHGTKTEAASREVPLIPAAKALLERLFAARQKTRNGVPHIDPKRKVLTVGEASKSLARACANLGVELLTHHDLRDAFATAAIEGGVDIPTVANWLGHSDGGALLMKVYAHHRRPHSLAQAAKVNFSA